MSASAKPAIFRLAAAALLVAGAHASPAAAELAYDDSIANGWSDWSWDSSYTNDTVLRKSGAASARVSIANAWGAFSLHRDAGAVNLNTLSAVSFDVNPGDAANVAGVAALRVTLQDSGNVTGQQATLADFAAPALAANAWSTVTVPISALQGGLAALARVNVQDGLGQGGGVFNVDNVALVPAAAPVAGCGLLSVDSGAAGAGKSLNGFRNDQYKWYDGACKPRSAALARNDASKGGNAKQFTYVLANGTTRVVNPSLGGAGGFGYVVAHLSNPSFAGSYGADDSPLGSGNAASYKKLFVGRHHAIHEYTLNYVRYGLTPAALANHSIDPWTWINGAADPNRQYVQVYNMPVRIHWLFATGRNYPLWSVSFDLSQAPDHAVDSDFRAPYGDMKVEGGDGSDLVGGVGWGDKYKFASAGNPFTMDNGWDYSQLNTGAPYDYLWTSAAGAEMGLAGTHTIARQNAGGYNNFQAILWRGKTSANIGQLCVNDQGAGPGYDHTMPCTSDWAYQLIQYSVASAAQTTNNKRLAWGADWGSLGNSAFVSTNGYAASGWPKVSYSTYVVLDPHSANPTQAVAKQARTISLTTLTANVGTVRTRGSAGVGRSDNKTYSPAGYSPVYGTWEVDALNNAVGLSFAVANTAPSTLDTPVIVVHNYARSALPRRITLDGRALAADKDYFASVRADKAELWVTLNKKLAGAHSLQITP